MTESNKQFDWPDPDKAREHVEELTEYLHYHAYRLESMIARAYQDHAAEHGGCAMCLLHQVRDTVEAAEGDERQDYMQSLFLVAILHVLMEPLSIWQDYVKRVAPEQKKSSQNQTGGQHGTKERKQEEAGHDGKGQHDGP